MNARGTLSASTLVIISCTCLNTVIFFVFLFQQSYPVIPMVLHLMSLVALWGLVFIKSSWQSLFKEKWKEVLVVVGLLILSLGVGVYQLEQITPGIYGDEVTVGRKSLELLEKPGLPPFDGVYSHPTPLMYLTAGSIHLFGRTPFAIRLPSVIFGALAVGALYVLLRLFFSIKISVMGSLLLGFQYTHVVLARLAYEPPASLFFQILSAIFITLYIKTKERHFLIGTALSLGAGLYTYLNFRAFAVVAIVLIIGAIVKLQRKILWQEIVLFFCTLFIATMPLISYSIIDPHGFWLRPAEISIFSRHYETSEFIKELAGNAYRIVLFPFIGDPNPGKNPVGMPLMDPMTVLIALVGCVYLFRTQRFLFWLVLLMFVPPFISDVFSTEVIPEFHYYGLGHPNALRVSGFIPVVIFAAAAGFKWAFDIAGKKHAQETLLFAGSLVGVICIWNTLLYFNQKTMDPDFYAYNYTVNRQDHMDLIKLIQQSSAKKISMTKPIAEFEHVPFFLHGTPVASFDVVSSESARQIIDSSDITAIDVSDQNAPILEELIYRNGLGDIKATVIMISDPIYNQPHIAVFEKTLY